VTRDDLVTALRGITGFGGTLTEDRVLAQIDTYVLTAVREAATETFAGVINDATEEVMRRRLAEVEAAAAERERIAGLADSVAAEYVDRAPQPCRCGAVRCPGVIIKRHASFADLIRAEP
jgi:hypothetical protein